VGNTYDRGKITNGYSLQCLGAQCDAVDNNGNLRKQKIEIPTNEQASTYVSWIQQYDYDTLNRLQSVSEVANGVQQWRQWFSYDRWGNRTIDATQDQGDPNPRTYGTGINNKAFQTEDATNRLYAPGDLALAENQRRIRYDLAGNQINDTYTGSGTATFDADNHIIAIQDKNGGITNYTYNADGQRTRRKIGNQETWQIYGMDGELLAEYPAAGATNAPQKEYGYRNGQLLITAEPSTGPSVNVALASNGAVAIASSTFRGLLLRAQSTATARVYSRGRMDSGQPPVRDFRRGSKCNSTEVRQSQRLT
jgi:YD repeat-containing protein